LLHCVRKDGRRSDGRRKTDACRPVSARNEAAHKETTVCYITGLLHCVRKDGRHSDGSRKTDACRPFRRTARLSRRDAMHRVSTRTPARLFDRDAMHRVSTVRRPRPAGTQILPERQAHWLICSFSYWLIGTLAYSLICSLVFLYIEY
jgi:hypothetical protein